MDVLPFIFALLIYLLPVFIAVGRKGGRGPAWLGLLLGWTMIGWVFALGWAMSLPRLHPTAQKQPERLCPYCAETIKAAAIVCRFCGRDIEPEAGE